jgi:general secretion pathway protein D
MRTIIQILVVGSLALMVYGQDDTASVQSVMEQLRSYQGDILPVVTRPAGGPVTAEPEAGKVQAEPSEGTTAPVTTAEVVLKPEAAADKAEVVKASPAGQKFKGQHKRTEEKAIEEVDQAWGSGLVMRYYSVTERFVKFMKLDGTKAATDITGKFSTIEFPEGSSAIYFPDLKKLIVNNTPANLSVLEEFLSAFGRAEAKASAEQVKIETRFVEFSEGALQELGFNWEAPSADFNLGGDWSVNDGGTPPGPQDLFSGALRTTPFDQTKNMNPDTALAEVSSRIGSSRIDNWNANRVEDMFSSNAGQLNVSGSVDHNPIDMLIRALDQTSGVDVLSAPSVVTLSGEPAVITVGERHFYPEVYEAGTSQGTVLHVVYQDFKEKVLGVEMTVTPVVTEKEIKLKINPRITELLGWEQFELAPKDSSYTYYQYRVGMQFEHKAVVAKLPIFKRREIKTEISVASGSTVGMGGLIGEKTEAFSDRVPVLGSIPLIGRLFRSEGERTVKRNLMIFVTASKVTPSGRMISERSFE